MSTPIRLAAWDGDFEQRLSDRLRSSGFPSATAYAASRPTESLVALADTLSSRTDGPRDTRDVAAFQLERRLPEEAQASGTLDHHARDLLVRRLHAHIPEGWRADWGPDVPGDVTTLRWRI